MKSSSEYVRLQINKVTSWIDGSFVYSSSEAWANTMRSFKNGSLLMEPTRKFPVRNTMRAPLFNHAVPHVMRMLSPERLYREFLSFYFFCTWQFSIIFFTIKKKKSFSSWRSTNKSTSPIIGSRNIVLSVAQCDCCSYSTGESDYVWWGYLSESKTCRYRDASGKNLLYLLNFVL